MLVRASLGLIAAFLFGLAIVKLGYAPEKGGVAYYVVAYGGAAVVWLTFNVLFRIFPRR